MLAGLGLWEAGDRLNPRIAPEFHRPRAGAACLRGLFGGAGHIHPPQRGYHLEIRLRSAELAADCAALMEAAGLRPGTVRRTGGPALVEGYAA